MEIKFETSYIDYKPNDVLSREVLTEKGPFWVRSNFTGDLFKVRRGKINKMHYDITDIFKKQCIQEGFYTVEEGLYEGYQILIVNVTKVS